MHRNFFTLFNTIVKVLSALFFCFALLSCQKDDSDNQDGLITQKQAVEIAQPIIDKYVAMGRGFLVSKHMVKAKKKIEVTLESRTYTSPNFKSWLIAIGPDPYINGDSPQPYIFVNVKTGDYEIISVNGWASNIEWDEDYMNFVDSSSESEAQTKSSDEILSTSTSNPHKWAVIISGGADKYNNWKRYWYDCMNVYCTLTEDLNYSEDNIFCLISDGTSTEEDRLLWANGYGTYSYDNSPVDLDNDGDDDVQYSASKSNISTVFNYLRSHISSGDEVLVFVTDHGSSNGKITLWGNDTLSPSELNAELDKIPSAKIDIVMGQCYSGSFILPLAAHNRSISTACSSSEMSRGSEYYDNFLKAWTDAIATSSSDSNSDGYISPYELFNYAEANDTYASSGVEHPQYGSTPLIFGYGHDLNGVEFWPVLSGQQYVSTQLNATYSLEGLPSSTSVTWSTSSDLSIVSSTNSSITVKGNITSGYVSTGGTISAEYTLEGTEYTTTLLLSSVWRPGSYTGYITGSNGNYMVTQYPGAYNYYWMSSNSAWRILSQGSFQVQVQEGTTNDPVDLTVGFYDPLGETIIITSRVKY